MGQYYNAVMKDRDGKVKVFNQQVKFVSGKNEDFNEYNGLKLMEHSWWLNDFCVYFASLLFNDAHNVAWIGDYAEGYEIEAAGFPRNILNRKGRNGKETSFTLDSVNYLVNHTKKEFVDLQEYKSKSDNGGWVIFPISLLCSIGNGRGGGDYYEDSPNYDKCGIWAGDLIELSNVDPVSVGYKKFDVYFKE